MRGVPLSLRIIYKSRGFDVAGLARCLNFGFARGIAQQRVAELLGLQELFADRRLLEAAHDAWVWSGPSFTAWAAYRFLLDQDDSKDPLLL